MENTENLSIIKAEKKNIESIKNKKIKTMGGFGVKEKGITEVPLINSFIDYRGIRKKNFGIPPEVLREIAEKVIIIGIIHNIRKQQLEPFETPAEDINKQGFIIKLKDKLATPTKAEEREMIEIEEFISHTGYNTSSERENFNNFSKKFYDDILTIDQIAIELGKNRKGELVQFRILDGATIFPVIKDLGYKGDKKIKYVQIYQDKVYATFTEDELIFGFSNPRSDLRFVDFGHSYEEQAIETITGWLYANHYNKDFFDKSSQPSGFISFNDAEGAIDEKTLKGIQREWEAMFQGLGNNWKTGFLGGGAKWNTIRPNNKDLEYNQYIQMLSSWLFALYGVDSAEAGLKLNQSNSLLGENKEAVIKYSQDRGLTHLLSFKESIINNILNRIEKWQKYKFVHTGIVKSDQKSELDIDKIKAETYMTVNEIRASKDLKPLDDGDVILNSFYLQHQQNKQMNEEENQNDNEEDQQDNDNFDFSQYEIDDKEEEKNQTTINEELEKSVVFDINTIFLK